MNLLRPAFRKIILTSLLAISAQSALLAQFGDSKYRFGLHFSPNYTLVTPETRLLNREAPKLGFGYGLIMERRIGENYFFSSGLSIQQLAYSNSIDSSVFRLPSGASFKAFNPIYEYRVQYIEVPLSMKMRTNQMGAIRIFGQFGMNLGVLARAQARVINTPDVFEPEEYFFINKVEDYRINEELTVDDRVSLFRASVLIAGGIEYLLSGDTQMLIGLRLDNPFTDAYRGDKLSGRTPSVGLQLGILF
ncbi:MAG: porin family protein [Bacteroidia bacterium]